MNTHADKTQKNKSQSVSNIQSQMQSGGESTFQFVDNRPKAVAQRKVQEMANNSLQVSQLRAFQNMANNSSQVKQAAQLQAMVDNYSAQQSQPIQNKENNTGLPDNLKSGIENLSGYSMDDVKVHYNSDRPAQLQAHAYAQGTDIHLTSGQEKHLPHEAWHVVQQKQGRVKPTVQMKGKVNVNDDAGLEKEADVMGAKAFSLGVASQTSELSDRKQTSSSKTSVLQYQKGSLSQDTNGLEKGTKVEILKNLGLSFRIKVIGTEKTYWINGEIKDFFSADVIEDVAEHEVASSTPVDVDSPLPLKEKMDEMVAVLVKQPKPKEVIATPVQQELAPTKKVKAPVEKEADSQSDFLIPQILSLKNLIRGDNRDHKDLIKDGFKPGKTVEGYFDKLKAFLDGLNDKRKSETTSQIMKDRIPDKAILNPEDKRHKQIDLVWSREKIEVAGGRKITLLNYVCTGVDSGAGGNDYLIKVDESFECISASPSIGLYQSGSGLQILAMGLSASPAKGELVKFHEYDFLTPIPPEKIYYNSIDGGKTQAVKGGDWFNVVTGKPL